MTNADCLKAGCPGATGAVHDCLKIKKCPIDKTERKDDNESKA